MRGQRREADVNPLKPAQTGCLGPHGLGHLASMWCRAAAGARRSARHRCALAKPGAGGHLLVGRSLSFIDLNILECFQACRNNFGSCSLRHSGTEAFWHLQIFASDDGHTATAAVSTPLLIQAGHGIAKTAVAS